MAEKLTKNDRRDAARQKAAEERARQAKAKRRQRIIIQSSIVLGALAVLVVIALVIVAGVNGARVTAAAANGPQNMASGGITLTSTTDYVKTPASKSIKPTANDDAKKVQIRVYEDYQCPYCHQFTATNTDYINQLLGSGKITYEIHPIAFLNNYSLRSASAAGCVANNDPNLYLAYNDALYKNQPDEATGVGLTNAKLASIAQDVGVKDQATLDCIKSGNRYADWFSAQTTYAQKKGAPGSDVKTVDQTPTIIIDNKKVTVDPTNTASFQALVVAAAKAKGLTL